MAKVKNLLHQPLILDFSKDYSVRFNAREVKDVKDSVLKTDVFKRNSKDLLVLTETKAETEATTDKKPKKQS